MTLNDLYAAQIEVTFFILLMLGACTTCVCMAIYISQCASAKIIADAISQQKVVIEKPVHDPTAVYNHWLNRPAMGVPLPLVLNDWK